MVESNIKDNNLSSLLSDKHLSGFNIKKHLKSKIQQISYYKSKEEKEEQEAFPSSSSSGASIAHYCCGQSYKALYDRNLRL